MGKINVLSFAVANLIAAGEVVDRPASVIKELMENAIDAGATRIVVEIQNGGVTLMRVSDNGCGISPEDLPVAIRRHATSKIKNASDLEGITTLGFRGEALAAIAAVSDLRILSRVPGNEMGAVLEAHGGNVLGVCEQGCAAGTTVIVENLFANVPARRKFLKKDVTETMAVTMNVEKVALSHPEIAVRLITDGTQKLETAGDGNLQNTIYAVFGKEFASRLIAVDCDSDGVSVHGFIGRTDNFRANRNYQNFFINGRYVKSKTAAAALEQAYTSYIPPEKFPCCVLFLGLNPARVDVNVHPAKLEVKFSNERVVFEAIYYSVRTALEGNKSRPSMQLEVGNRSKRPFGSVRMSDVAIPLPEGRGESLAKRQLSYDQEGRTQPQPQSRMTAEEYRNLYVPGQKQPIPRETTPSPIVPPSMPSPPPAVRNAGGISAGGCTFPTGGGHAPLTPDNGTPTGKTTGATAPEALQIPDLPNSAPEQIPMQETEDRAVVQEEKSDRQERTTLPESDARLCAPEPPIPAGEATDETLPASAETPSYRILGEVFRTYVIVETGDKMLLVDKHAAHERILFEQLKAGLSRTETVSQLLMLPLEVMMTSGEVEALKEYAEELEKIGFSLRFARNTVSADAIPEGVASSAVPEMLQTMAGRILNATGSVRLTRDIIFEKALYQAACKAAIKAGRDYADEHIAWIISKLMELPDITFCPHGRPVALEITHGNLDRQFDRTGF